MLKLPEELVGKERQRPGTNWGSPGRTGQEAEEKNRKKRCWQICPGRVGFVSP